MENSEYTFSVLDDEGNELECEAICTYEDEESGKKYIIYTDNSVDSDGRTQIYASIFDPENEDSCLLPIETEEEWELIDSILKSLEGEEPESN